VWLERLRMRIGLHAGNFLAADGGRAKLEYVWSKARRVGHNAVKNARRAWKGLRERPRRSMPSDLAKVESAGAKARDTYDPRPYAGRITLFRATQQPPWFRPDPYLGWGRFAAGGIDVVDIPGHHGAIVYEPRVARLARELAGRLPQAVAGESR